MSVISRVNEGPLTAALKMLPARMDSLSARVLILTTGMQESRLVAQRQYGGGPAHGIFQFEKGGGVRGVLTHPASKPYALDICKKLGVEPTVNAVHSALAQDGDTDILDCAFARLLYWTDLYFLPAPEDATGMWNYYIRVWNPGKPHEETWDDFHAEVLETLTGSDQ